MMIIVRRQLFYALAALLLNLFAQQCETQAELTLGRGGGGGVGVAGLRGGVMDAVNINNLYDNLLQREYAGPVVFPNHQVERKAQRSPSLRLRFGRRSDPDMLSLQQLSAAKRWFGDVNQKPIRSPSRRLRFGRRSDPSVPLHTAYDALLNDLLLSSSSSSPSSSSSLSSSMGNNNYNSRLNYAAAAAAPSASGQMYNDMLLPGEVRGDVAEDDDYDVNNLLLNNEENDEGFERIVRKPQRLRWGRSVQTKQQQENRFANMQETQNEEDRKMFADLMRNEDVRNILISNLGLATDMGDDEEFEREVRKPGPLRLRWGRSTGGRVSAADHKDSENQEMDKSALNSKSSKADSTKA